MKIVIIGYKNYGKGIFVYIFCEFGFICMGIF